MFAPPDAESHELRVDLAPDEALRSAQKHASIPASPESSRRCRRAVSVAPRDAAIAAGRCSSPDVTKASPSGLANPNLRFAAGVVIAIVVGFVPAHFVASMRERSAFEAIDNKVLATQRAAETDDAYAALDTFREEQLGRKHDDRRNIAITALLVWAIAGSAIGYVWFRRINWDRFETFSRTRLRVRAAPRPWPRAAW